MIPKKLFWWTIVIVTFLWIIYSIVLAKLAIAEERVQWFGESTGVYTMEKGATSGKFCIAGGKFLNDWASVRAETQIGRIWYKESSGMQTAGLFIIRFDPKLYKELRFFTEVGVGIGYVNTKENEKLIKPGMTGHVDSGIGFIFPIGWKKVDFLIGYKFSHVSSLKPGDKGINTHGVMVGLRF